MVKERKHNLVTLIYNYSENGKSAFVHEGFNFFLRLYNDNIYLGINPCVVITSDGINNIKPRDLSQQKYKEYKKWFVDRRYNSKIRDLLNTFIFLLSDNNDAISIPTFNGLFVIENKFLEIG